MRLALARLTIKVADRWNHYTETRRLRRWTRRVGEIREAGRSGYRASPAEARVVLSRSVSRSGVLELGEIDQDGHLRPLHGHAENAPEVNDAAFIPRRRNRIFLVVIDDVVGIRKEYGKPTAFLRELQALHRLSPAGRRVPAILDVDTDVPSITMSYLPGPVLRESLAELGARIRNRDFDFDPELVHIPKSERQVFAIQEARPLMQSVIDAKAAASLIDEVDRIHSLGVLIGDVKYGNVVLEARSGLPYLFDFDHARTYTRMPRWLFAPYARQERNRVVRMLDASLGHSDTHD